MTDPLAFRAQQVLSPPDHEVTWRPERGAGTLVGGLLLVLSIAMLVVALNALGEAAGAVRMALFLVCLAVIGGMIGVGSLLVRLRSIRYVTSPQGVTVSVQGQRIVVSHAEIVEAVYRPRDRIELGAYERFWPGYYDAEIATSEGLWRSVATTPPNRRVRLRLRGGRTLAISPEHPVLFVEAVHSFRRGLAPALLPEMDSDPAPSVPAQIRPQSPAAEAPLPMAADVDEVAPGRLARPSSLWPSRAYLLFRDRIVRGDRLASNLLALSLIGLILFVTVTVWRADAIDRPVAVHWNADGEPDRMVRPDRYWLFEGVWLFPVTAAAVIVINAALATLAVYHDQLRAARVLLAGALPVELLLLVALLRATG